MSGNVLDPCWTSAEVCRTCPACPAYFAITASLPLVWKPFENKNAMDPLLTQKVNNRHVKKHRRFLSDQIVTSRFLLHLDDDDQDDKSSGRNFIPNFFSNTPVHVIFVLVTKERLPISVRGQ